MSPQELTRRIERLERQNRTMKIALAACLAVAGLAAASQSRTVDYDVVRAKRFTILDDNGKERGLFGTAGTTATLRFGKSLVDNQVRIDAEENRTIQLMTHPKVATHRLFLNVNTERSVVQAEEFREAAKGEPQE